MFQPEKPESAVGASAMSRLDGPARCPECGEHVDEEDAKPQSEMPEPAPETLPPVPPGSEAFVESGDGHITFVFPLYVASIALTARGHKPCLVPPDYRHHVAAVAIEEWRMFCRANEDNLSIEAIHAEEFWRAWRDQKEGE